MKLKYVVAAIESKKNVTADRRLTSIDKLVSKIIANESKVMQAMNTRWSLVDRVTNIVDRKLLDAYPEITEAMSMFSSSDEDAFQRGLTALKKFLNEKK